MDANQIGTEQINTQPPPTYGTNIIIKYMVGDTEVTKEFAKGKNAKPMNIGNDAIFYHVIELDSTNKPKKINTFVVDRITYVSWVPV